jgi:hypothetical protein
MRKVIDLAGKKFGRLIVIKRNGYLYGNRVAWLCKCECGKLHTVLGASLKSGNTRSCECLRNEIASKGIEERTRIHGEGKNRTLEYNSWTSMRQRCLSLNHPGYKDYGGRGIHICERWGEYENFLSDMGRRPTPQHTLERVNNNKGYSPSNCKWATKKEQANNARSNTLITYNGKTMTLAMWSDESGIPGGRIRKRISSGWTLKAALYKPLRKTSRGRS